jgi:transcriptional regulator with XRE-family HTH domain
MCAARGTTVSGPWSVVGDSPISGDRGHLGDCLTRLRRLADVTQEGLAERSGVSVDVIRKLLVAPARPGWSMLFAVPGISGSPGDQSMMRSSSERSPLTGTAVPPTSGTSTAITTANTLLPQPEDVLRPLWPQRERLLHIMREATAA